MRRLLLLTLLTGIGLLFAAGPASAAQPCWRQLVNDWYDGRIDKVYPVSCYREAMKHVDEDARVYSSLPEDLTRALQSAIQTKSGDRVVPGGAKGRHPGQKSATRRTRKTRTVPAPVKGEPKGKRPATTKAIGPLPGRQKPKGFFARMLDTIGPSNADSIPLPLIFLAGLALVLTAAGAAGMVTRRVQARRVGGDPTDRPPAP